MVVGLSLYPVTTTTRSESSETAEAQALFSPLLCVPKVSNLFGTLASKFIASMTWIQSSGQILSWKIWAISWKLNSLTRKALNRPSSSELYEWQKSVLTCINFMSEEIDKVVKSMKPNTAPGPDGFSVSFLELFVERYTKRNASGAVSWQVELVQTKLWCHFSTAKD